MQFLLIAADILMNIDMEEELVTFLCSVIAFFILISCRNCKVKKGGKLFKHIEVNADDSRTGEYNTRAHDDKCYVKIDTALRIAFDEEEYWKVLGCWRELKHFNQSSIHLSMIIQSMRFCNKGAFFIMNELKDFFKAHPQECTIGLINDLLEPLARRPDHAQLVELLLRMIPCINLEKDPRTYEIMLTMRAASGNLSKMQEVTAEMNAKEVVFTPRATVALMSIGLQTGNADVVLKALTKLKPSWNERDTWPVSMFALERHKMNVLMQVVTLACQKLKVCELSLALDGLKLPEDVLDALESKLSSVSDDELAGTIEAIQRSGRKLKTDPIYNTLIGCASSRSVMKSLRPWEAKKWDNVDSTSSAGEGSSSDSDEVGDATMVIALPPCKIKKMDHTGVKPLPHWKAKNMKGSDSNASTSDGSRSDSEEESNSGPCVCLPPGLAPPPGF